MTLGGTITGDVTFATGFISGDTDDLGSGPGQSDNLTLLSGAILKGNLTANLSTSQDTVHVGGEVTKKLTVANNGNVGVMVDSTGIIDGSASIALGTRRAEQFYFDGTVGPTTGSPSTTVLTVTSASNSSVVAEIGNDAKVFGTVMLNLSQSSDIVNYDQFASITGTLFAFGNGTAASTFFAHRHHVRHRWRQLSADRLFRCPMIGSRTPHRRGAAPARGAEYHPCSRCLKVHYATFPDPCRHTRSLKSVGGPARQGPDCRDGSRQVPPG